MFQARDTALGLQVAVKIIATEGPRSAGLSLKEEALAAMRLSHRFIARTYHWERFGTYEAIVMELVTGGTLADWIGCAHNQRRRIEQGAGFVIDALDGLAYAHDLDVLHNDIKPQNLLVGVGEQIKLCDFGISVALGDSSRRGHGAAGTVTYLSPERIRSGGSSPASDIYAIGAVLYELITGAPPFGVGFAAIDGHLDQPVPAMPGVPRELELVVHAALAKDPLDRPSTAHDMRDALIQAGFTSRWQVINGDERTGPSRPPFFRAAPQARPADSSTGDTLTPDPQIAPRVASGPADADEVDDDPTDQGAGAKRALSLTDPADPPPPRQARRDAPESASMAPNQPWPTPRTPSAPPRSPRNEPDPSAPNHAPSSPAAPARVDAPAPPRAAPLAAPPRVSPAIAPAPSSPQPGDRGAAEAAGSAQPAPRPVEAPPPTGSARAATPRGDAQRPRQRLVSTYYKGTRRPEDEPPASARPRTAPRSEEARPRRGADASEHGTQPRFRSMYYKSATPSDAGKATPHERPRLLAGTHDRPKAGDDRPKAGDDRPRAADGRPKAGAQERPGAPAQERASKGTSPRQEPTTRPPEPIQESLYYKATRRAEPNEGAASSYYKPGRTPAEPTPGRPGGPRVATSDGSPTPPPTTRPPSPPATRPPDAGRLPEAASPPEGMVKIPARQASWAGASWDVRPFHLDRRPVTNAEYAAFVEGTDALPPAWWHGRIPPADRADHPVVGVKLRDARAYAAWRGRRLPTADEWLSAARPVATSVFPWTTGCGAATCHCPRAGHRTTSPVNAHPDGRSQDGVEDLYGNVWEWVEPSARVPAREAGATLVFGASFRHPCSAPDGRVPATEVLLDADYLYLGFRCASDMKQ